MPSRRAWQTASQSTGAAKWTNWGRLKKTAYKLQDGQPIFRLEEDRGGFTYAVAAPGYSLETYEGKTVTLYGPAPPAPAARVPEITPVVALMLRPGGRLPAK